MKQNKRFALIALVLVLVLGLCAGAMAEAAPITVKLSKFNVNGTGEETLKMNDVDIPTHFTDSNGEERYYFSLAPYFLDPEYTKPDTYKNDATYVGEQIKWTVSDTSIATLTKPYNFKVVSVTVADDDGAKYATEPNYPIDVESNYPTVVLTGKPGELTVTAANQDGTVKASIKFTLQADEDPTVKNPVTKIEFTQESYTIKLGSTTLNDLDEYVTFIHEDETKPFESRKTVWSSSDKTVATVDNTGFVTVKKIGSAEITVTVMNMVSGTTVSGKATVNVADNPVTAVEFVPAEYEMAIGQNEQYFRSAGKLLITPTDANFDRDENGAITFISSDPTVATISTNGDTLTAIGPGEATITATLYNKVAKNYVTGKFTVKVGGKTAVEKIEFTEKVYTIGIGDPIDLYDFVRLTPDADLTGFNKGSLHWTSSDITIASVDNDGDVWGYTPGDVTIKAFIYDKVAKKTITGECTVKVLSNYAPLEKLSFTQDEYKLIVGDELDLYDFLIPEPWDIRDSLVFTFTTSDYSVARVTKQWGYVYAVGVGEATITASVYNVYSKTTVTAETKIKVSDPVAATAVTFAPKSLTLNKGDAVKIGTQLNSENYIVVTPADAAGYDLTLTSSDEEIVTVDYDDINDYWHIHGDNVGTATVTATVYNRVAKTYVTAPLEVKVEENIPLKGFAFKKESYTLKLNQKKEIDLKKQIAKDPVNAILDTDMLLWESSDLQVAEVYDGVVTAKNPGTATITAKLLDKDDKVLLTAKTEIKAVPITIEKVALDKKEARLAFYATGNRDYNTSMVATVVMQPANGYYKRIEWQSSDAGVAVVSTEKSDLYINGGGSSSSSSCSAYIKATGLGEAIITVDVYTVDDAGNEVKRTATMNVLVSEKLVQLKLNVAKRTLYLKKGEEVTFQLEATDKSNDELVPVRWTSSAPKIAKVDRDGVVTALKAGKAVITATTKDGNKTTATATVTVKKLKVTKVTVAKTLKMKVGDIITPTITVKPATAFNTALKFKSSNAKVVSVSADGEFTALKAGKAVITITAADGSKKSAKITVTVTK